MYTINTSDGRVLENAKSVYAVVEKRNSGYVVNVYHFGSFRYTAIPEGTKSNAVFGACDLGKIIALCECDYGTNSFLRYVSLGAGEQVSLDTEKTMYGLLGV